MSQQSSEEEHQNVSIKALSDSEKQEFKLFASEMYGHSHFKGAQMLSIAPPSEDELVAFIELQIRDGLHISFLEETEKDFLKRTFGDKWFEKYGYVEQDVTELFTLLE